MIFMNTKKLTVVFLYMCIGMRTLLGVLSEFLDEKQEQAREKLKNDLILFIDYFNENYPRKDVIDKSTEEIAQDIKYLENTMQNYYNYKYTYGYIITPKIIDFEDGLKSNLYFMKRLYDWKKKDPTIIFYKKKHDNDIKNDFEKIKEPETDDE